MRNQTIRGFALLGLVAGALLGAAAANASPLLNYQFNEGSGTNVTDSASGVNGIFGLQQNSAVDYTALIDASPSGAPGDRCITNTGAGFLLADDSAAKILDRTNSPLTIETWIFIDTSTPAKSAEGIIAYGQSYKLGMKGGQQVFTLYGIADITNTMGGYVPAGAWAHVAAAWDPGVGVHFFINGIENFEANTNTARPVLHHYLSLGSEGFANNSVSALDRVRIHSAVLTAEDLDSVAETPKAALPSTLVNYRFNESAFPCSSSLTPALPTQFSSVVLPAYTSPVWSSDSPTGLPGDYSLAFTTVNPLIKEIVTVNYGSTPIDLGVNNTNYTLQAWVKLPTGPYDNRRVIYRTDGPAPRVSLSINATHAPHSTLYGNTDFAPTALIPDDHRWHHVAAVMEGFARMKFYVDGILRQTINRTAVGATTATANPGNLLIGKESDTLYFRGYLDRVLVNNDALTEATIDYPAIPGLPVFAALNAHPADVATNLGATARFIVSPTSANSVQWYYRTNLADPVGVLIPGATGNMLTIANVTADKLGYYYAKASNNVGTTESYAARLRLPPDLGGKLIDFEEPAYISGILEGQDEWTNDQNGDTVRVLTSAELTNLFLAAKIEPGQTVHSGNQALAVTGPGLATSSLRAFTGFETKKNVTFDFWARPLSGATIGNVFFTVENAAATRAAGIRFGPGLSIDYGLVSGAWVASGLIANADTWYHFMLKLDYTQKSYDFYVDDVKVNTTPIPFYTATSDSFRQVRIFRGANQAGVILDDLNAPGPLSITSVKADAGVLTIKWAGGTAPYQLQRRSALDSGTWQNAGPITSNTETTDTPGAGPMFYRVVSN